MVHAEMFPFPMASSLKLGNLRPFCPPNASTALDAQKNQTKFWDAELTMAEENEVHRHVLDIHQHTGLEGCRWTLLFREKWHKNLRLWQQNSAAAGFEIFTGQMDP